MRPITRNRMTQLIAERIRWYRLRLVDDEETPTRPPADVAANILATPDHRFPVLHRILTMPVYGGDGKLQTDAGYYPSSRTLYIPLRGFQLPLLSNRPSEQHLKKAFQLLFDELLGDCPFTGDADKAHVLCALLLPFVRNMIAGPTPLHLMTKPVEGTGATLLAEIVCRVSTGKKVAALTPPSDESEWRRTLLSVLREGPVAVLLDNADCVLDSRALASVLTTELHSDRVVGVSDLLSVLVEPLWLATGNNPALSPAIARRSIPIRLDERMERPDFRSHFRHKNLKTWASENQEQLVWAVLTLIQAWIAAGCPAGSKTLGSYESWAETMGGILDVIGVPGFLGNLADLRERTDQSGNVFSAFVKVWYEMYEDNVVSVRELLPLAEEVDLGRGDGKSRRICLGKLLQRHGDRRFGDVCIRNVGVLHGSQQWKLELVVNNLGRE